VDQRVAQLDGSFIPRKPSLVTLVDGLLGVFGPRRPMSAQQLVTLARRRTGLTDFGPEPFVEALRIFVRSLEEEADLSAFGRMGARWDALRFLSNLLVLREDERKDPTILEERIERPIFICGLPRSGTTFLHRILAEDPSNAVVRCWETIYPCPAPTGKADADRRARRVDSQLAMFAWLAPEMSRIHPMSARSPQECTEITGHVFASLRFDTTYHVPTYRRWLDRSDHLTAFRFHKRFLQHLQRRRGPRQWVLKCPDHVFALDAIRAVYPDARFIFMHRNPIEVLASLARLTEVLRLAFAHRIDRLEIGRLVSGQWSQGAARLLEAATAAGRSSDSILNIGFPSFVKDPSACLPSIYERFGLTMSADAATRLRRYVAEQPRGGYGANASRLEDYGLNAEEEGRHYKEYMAYFNV